MISINNLKDVGIIYFSRNNILDTISIYLSNIEYSCVGFYYKTDTKKYEIYYTYIYSMGYENFLFTTFDQLYSDISLKNIMIKPLNNDDLNFKFRYMVASLSRSKIDIDATISDLLGLNFKTENKDIPINLILDIIFKLNGRKLTYDINNLIGSLKYFENEYKIILDRDCSRNKNYPEKIFNKFLQKIINYFNDYPNNYIFNKILINEKDGFYDDSINRYEVGRTLKSYFDFWNNLTFQINNYLDINHYNEILLDNYKNYALEPMEEINFFSETTTKYKIPNIDILKTNEIKIKSILSNTLIEKLQDLTLDTIKDLYTSNKGHDLNINKFKYNFEYSTRILSVFTNITLNLPSFDFKYIKCTYLKSNDKINYDTVSVNNYLNTFNTIWYSWQTLLMILHSNKTKVLLNMEIVKNLITKINYKFDIIENIKLKDLKITKGSKYFIENKSLGGLDLKIKHGRINYKKIKAFLGYIKLLWLKIVNLWSLETVSYLILTKNYFNFDFYIKKAIYSLNFKQEKFESYYKYLPENIDIFNISYTPNEFPIKNFFMLNDDLTSLLNENDRGNLPLIDFNTFLNNWNHINENLKLGFDSNFDRFEKNNFCILTREIENSHKDIILTSGRKICINITNPVLDNLEKDLLEEILNHINNMYKNDIDIINIQTRIINKIKELESIDNIKENLQNESIDNI